MVTETLKQNDGPSMPAMHAQQSPKKKIAYLEIIRIVACFFVIMNHTVSDLNKRYNDCAHLSIGHYMTHYVEDIRRNALRAATVLCICIEHISPCPASLLRTY